MQELSVGREALPYQSDLVSLGCPEGHTQHKQSRKELHDGRIVNTAVEAPGG